MTRHERHLSCHVSETLWNALRSECERTGDSLSHVVGRALASELDIVHHSLFQVSTSAALVEGVFQGCIRVRDLKRHGDFGLGTYDSLNGELILLDGRCYKVGAEGVARQADDEALVPFAVITRFMTDQHYQLAAAQSYDDLLQ